MKRLALLPLMVATAWAAPKGPFLDEGLDTGVEPAIDEAPSHCQTTFLRDGVQLPETTLYRRWHAETAWGTPEMIDLLEEAADTMHALAPNADPFVVGDISAEGGGALYGHRSHRAGIDADIGLYFGKGRQHLTGFQVVPPADLDAETTWLLIHTLLDSGVVERILLDRGLIDVLRNYVIETGELSPDEADEIFSPAGTPEIWRLTGVVHHAANHKHHMHVRLRCGVE